MKILALNTAFANSDIAISIDGKVDYVSHSSNAKQSENALVCIDELLSKNNEDIQDIDVMAVVIGPGSFTGIRIGMGLVKGMAVAKESLKLIGICSLDLLAFEYYQKNKNAGEFTCVLDALSGNLFVCTYQGTKRTSQPKMLTGEDYDKMQGTIVGLKCENLGFCTDYVEFCAENLLNFAIEKAENNEFTSEQNLLPLYLRKSQAEMGLQNANKKD